MDPIAYNLANQHRNCAYALDCIKYDLEMVKNAGVGIAVFDSYDELKQVAKFITTSSASNGAFSEAINKYIE